MQRISAPWGIAVCGGIMLGLELSSAAREVYKQGGLGLPARPQILGLQLAIPNGGETTGKFPSPALAKRLGDEMYPTAQQRQTLQQWLGTARFVYNRTLDFLKSLEGERPPGCK
ncbi:helix-turn-helix domain-containing protein [Synechococcus sp. R6-5]|uniref:helix-turn-helix domain-containing protein n=1 Tax=Synechococcus sp. R6-5 TaxID=2421326 RepID=UPI0039C06A0C